jgi:hypothetical protein
MTNSVDDLVVSAVAIADEINTIGAACLESIVSEDWLHEAREYISTYLPMDRHELFIENPDTAKAQFVGRLVCDPRLKSLLESVAAADCPPPNRDRSIATALRILDGPGPDKPLWFHYDGTVITVVVPIVIPNAPPGMSGELLISPNRRPYRRFAIANIVEKFISQNDFYRKRFVRKLGHDGKVIPLVPGNAYLFWGYRTYHATLPCPPDTLRVTLVLHYGALHHGNRLLSAAKSAHRRMRNLGRPTAY